MTRLLLMVLSLSFCALGQAPSKCSKCQGTGLIACTSKDHDTKKHCGISRPHLCDAVLGAKCCGGLQKIACANCNRLDIAEELDRERITRESWLATQRKYDTDTRIQMSHVQTDNMIVHWSPLTWKVGETILSRSRAAHLYADRVEHLAEKFKKVTGVLPTQRQSVWIMKAPAEEGVVTLLYMGGGYTSPFKQLGQTGNFATWPNRQTGTTEDEFMHQHVIHNTTHLLVEAGHNFRLEFSPWFVEGLAHWMEIEYFGEARNYCFQEINVKGPWENAGWPKKLFGEISGGKDLPLSGMYGKKMDQMSHRDTAYNWSFVDGLIRSIDEAKFPDYYRTLKSTNDGQAALDQVFGLSSTSFQERWRAWALKRYGAR